MARFKRLGAGVLAVALIALILWIAMTQIAFIKPPKMELFSRTGNLIQNNPGFKPDAWYLSYEMPGEPGKAVELKFNDESRCGSESGMSRCERGFFEQGARVRVDGTLRNGTEVLVNSITKESVQEQGTPIELYVYDPARDQGPGGAQCSDAGLVAVQRVIPRTTAPLTESIKLLIRGELSEEERADGLTTEFPIDGLTLKSATIDAGVATLVFDDALEKTGGGSCRVSILTKQIIATAKQFPGVSDVEILPLTIFQP